MRFTVAKPREAWGDAFLGVKLAVCVPPANRTS